MQENFFVVMSWLVVGKGDGLNNTLASPALVET